MIFIDYIIIIVMSFSCVLGLIRGFIREVLSTIVWIYIFFFFNHHNNYLLTWFSNIKNELVRRWTTIVVLTVVLMIFNIVINCLMDQLIRKANLSLLNQIIGACFGVLRGFLIITVIIYLLDNFTEVLRGEYCRNSQLIPLYYSSIKTFYLANTKYFRSKF